MKVEDLQTLVKNFDGDAELEIYYNGKRLAIEGVDLFYNSTVMFLIDDDDYDESLLN